MDNNPADQKRLLRAKEEIARTMLLDCQHRQHVTRVQLAQHLQALGHAEAAVAGARVQLASLERELAVVDGLLREA